MNLPLDPKELDVRHLDLHTDCVAFEYRFKILAATCYELDESSPTDSQVRAGSVHFYYIDTSNSEKTVLKDITVDNKKNAGPEPFFACPAGVFDIRWSLEASLPSKDFATLVLAFTDGTTRKYKVSPISEIEGTSSPSYAYSSLTIEELYIYQPESDGDLAIGVDLAHIKNFEPLEDDDEEEMHSNPDESSEGNADSTNTTKSAELAVVGYQTGAISVFNLDSGSTTPVWSCPDAHMAEVWQTQWVCDSTYNEFVSTSLDDVPEKTFSSYGRSVGTLFLSGSDDCSFKLWDIRRDSSRGAVAENRKFYSMGITSLASPLASPCAIARNLLPNTILVGSYDESLAIWDLRSLSRPLSSIKLDGGVWRLRWLPTLPLFEKELLNSLDASQMGESTESTHLAVTAMHAGFKIVEISKNSEMTASASLIASYWGPHSGSPNGQLPPLAYGIDWASRASLKDGRVDLKKQFLISCTFYDNCVSLWRP